jgi:flagella basal body P-ring formation protein FlgA
MRRRVLLLTCVLAVPTAASPADVTGEAGVRAAIATSVSSSLGGQARVSVEVLQPVTGINGAVTASPLPGARFGVPARFLVTLTDGRKVATVARVTADAGHVVASRNVPRDAEFAADDVAWIEGPLEGQLVEALPSLNDVIGNHARRAIARGEVLTSTVIQRPAAVRGGDSVTMVIRVGVMEVRGTGRAVSSGSIGDVIRVLRPGSREPLRGRIVEPALVEILK